LYSPIRTGLIRGLSLPLALTMIETIGPADFCPQGKQHHAQLTSKPLSLLTIVTQLVVYLNTSKVPLLLYACRANYVNWLSCLAWAACNCELLCPLA